jgi:uncharacterized spore protein YtfJ
MTTVADVEREIGRRMPGPVDSLIDRIADRLGGRASVEAVFGTPVERGGVTVIPVAKVRWGFGGGGGMDRSATDQAPAQGSGGGGGVVVSPLGYIEIKSGSAEFRLIRDPAALLTVAPVILAGGISALLLLRGLRRLFRG